MDRDAGTRHVCVVHRRTNLSPTQSEPTHGLHWVTRSHYFDVRPRASGDFNREKAGEGYVCILLLKGWLNTRSLQDLAMTTSDYVHDAQLTLNDLINGLIGHLLITTYTHPLPHIES